VFYSVGAFPLGAHLVLKLVASASSSAIDLSVHVHGLVSLGVGGRGLCSSVE
jgi:hypothetical protein